MRRSLTGIAVLIGVTALLPSTAAAQTSAEPRADQREGVWFSLAAGTGWDRLSCGICAGERRNGLSGAIAVGGTLDSRWLLGGETSYWSNASDGIDETLVSIGILAAFYPNAASGLHLRGGLGYLAYEADDGEDSLGTTSFGPHAGIGYDLSVGNRLSLTPQASLMVTPFGDLTFNDEKVRGDVRSSYLRLSVGLTWH